MYCLVVAGDNDLEAKYRRSVLDIAVLQDHIAVQCESVRTVQSDRVDLRRRMRDMEQTLQHERQDHRDVNSDFSRQYKTMQIELTNKVKRLEKEVSRLNEELALCQEELRKERREREQMEQEKDTAMNDLQHKMDNMETDYEKILHDTLDSLTSQLPVTRQRREDESTTLHQHHKALLSEFGLNARDM
uniref:Dynein regulatory complex protein 12 n=1 Tax=Scophthalmus maximus TaxID=52904 RepID=A0A8D3AZ10_SCOMX